MGKVDRRTTGTKQYAGGSSLLDVGLAAPNAQEALLDEDAIAAWYTLGELEGGEMGENASETVVKNEVGETVLVIEDEADEFEIGQTSLSTDDTTLALLDYLGRSGHHKMRYPLPAGTDANGHRLYQVWCFPNARVKRENWRMPIKNKEARKRPFKIVAERKNGQPLYIVKTVRLDDQTTWPAEMAAFKDTAIV